MVDSQVYISNNVIQIINSLIEQDATPNGIHCYNIHHELILSDSFTNSDIYNNDKYTPYAD